MYKKKSRSGKSLSKSRQEKMADELACASASPFSRRLLLEPPRCLGRPHALLAYAPTFGGWRRGARGSSRKRQLQGSLEPACCGAPLRADPVAAASHHVETVNRPTARRVE
jgi:hypothetical protein